MAGEVIGVNTAIYSPNRDGGSVGVGFSSPSSIVQSVVNQLLQYGETRRGWLGVRIQEVDDQIAESIGLGRARGALVAGVDEKGPALPAGIRAGDVIVRFDGQDVRSSTDLPRIVAATPVGKEVNVTVVRGGKEENLKVTLGRLEDGQRQASLGGGTGGEVKPPANVVQRAAGMEFAGMTAALRKQYNIRDNVNGVVVTTVTPNSPAAEKRVQPGDVIVEINQQAIRSLRTWSRVWPRPRSRGASPSCSSSRTHRAKCDLSRCRLSNDSSRSLLNGRACPGHFRLSLYSAIQSDFRIPLRVEKRGEVAEVDARVSSRRDGGLCVKRHAKARFLQHGEIVGAVADSHGLFRLEAIHVAQFDQCCELRFAPKDGLGHHAGKLPSSTTSVLARFSWKPMACAICDVNSVKPPETSAVCAPFARIVRTSARPPFVSVMRSSITCATTPASNPFNSATRSRSAGSKAISPRIARSVMAETCSFMPTRSASSSMHSCPIMVESISARNSFLRRPASGWQTTSMGRTAERVAHFQRQHREAVLVGVRGGEGNVACFALGQPARRAGAGKEGCSRADDVRIDGCAARLRDESCYAEITCDPRLSRPELGAGKVIEA